MHLYPGPATGLALLFGFFIVPMLVFLSHGTARIDSAKQRFLTAIALCIFAWGIIIGAMMMMGRSISWPDILAGSMILFTAIVAFGILWSLVCWGFTTSLLAALCSIDGAANRYAWFHAYGGGSSIADFTDDRLSILLGLGIAKIDETSVMLSGRLGYVIASSVIFLRRFYGLPDE